MVFFRIHFSAPEIDIRKFGIRTSEIRTFGNTELRTPTSVCRSLFDAGNTNAKNLYVFRRYGNTDISEPFLLDTNVRVPQPFRRRHQRPCAAAFVCFLDINARVPQPFRRRHQRPCAAAFVCFLDINVRVPQPSRRRKYKCRNFVCFCGETEIRTFPNR